MLQGLKIFNESKHLLVKHLLDIPWKSHYAWNNPKEENDKKDFKILSSKIYLSLLKLTFF